MPFEIPESWEWVTLGEISNYGQTKHAGVDKINDIDWVLELEDIEKDSAQLVQKLNRKERNISGVRSQFEKGQILYSKLRTYLNKVLVAPSNGYCTTEIIPFSCFGSINNHYITQVLRSKYFIDYTILCCYGCKMPRLGTDDAKKGLIPLPPINEQKRIVSTIEKWFALIDELEANKEDLRDYIKQVKSKVLDLAIHGKLVPQDPNDEPAIELLKRINPNFKSCDTSHYENLPHEIPLNWVWVKHNDVISVIGGAQPPKSNFRFTPQEGYIRLYQIRDYGKSPIPVYIPIEMAQKTTRQGDILLARYGASLGKVFIAEEGAYNVAMAKADLKCDNIIEKDFLYSYYLSDIYQTKLKSISRTAQAGFNATDLSELYFPIPPLPEQRLIMKTIKKIFSTIDSISAEL